MRKEGTFNDKNFELVARESLARVYYNEVTKICKKIWFCPSWRTSSGH